MYEIYEKILKEKGLKSFDVAKATGIATSSLTDWKKGRCTPRIEKIQKIAEFLGVSVDYLMTGKEQKEEHYYRDKDARDAAEFLFNNPEYKVLFDAARTVSKDDIEFVKEMIERMVKK